MKPLQMRCKKYCDLYPCDRINCSRKPIWHANEPIQMVEPKIYNRWRLPELMRLYKEVPLTKIDTMTKYN